MLAPEVAKARLVLDLDNEVESDLVGRGMPCPPPSLGSEQCLEVAQVILTRGEHTARIWVENSWGEVGSSNELHFQVPYPPAAPTLLRLEVSK